MSDDLISRKAAIDAIVDWAESHHETPDGDDCIMIILDVPPAQPDIIWGLPVSADRPLADVEIVPRLRDIQKQIPGGSYAIDRAIEIIEAVAERITDE